jgi:hypothetical protein
MSHAATFEDWASAYEKIYEAPDRLQTEACPNCGHRALRLVFTLPHPSAEIGSVAFWCDHCLNGIILGRSKVRPGLETISTEESDVASSDHPIPDFRLVPPSSWGGGDEHIH